MKFSLNNIITKLAICGIALGSLGHYCYKEYSRDFSHRKTPAPSTAKPHSENSAKLAASLRPSEALDKVISSNTPSITTERSIAIFENGTSVFVSEPTHDHVAEASVKLHRLGENEIKFSVFRVEDGSYIVSFSNQGITQWVYPQEVNYIQNMSTLDLKNYLSEREISTLPTNWNPTLEGRVGLLARAWLMSDLYNPKVHKILKGVTTLQKDSASD